MSFEKMKEKLNFLLDKIEYRNNPTSFFNIINLKIFHNSYHFLDADYPNCFGWKDDKYKKELFDFVDYIKKDLSDIGFELILFMILERAKKLLIK